jgi:RNA polymerase sigma-54 factor
MILSVVTPQKEQNQWTVKVAEEIAAAQCDFFKGGEKKSLIKPLTMVELAERLGIHASTVSRAVDGAYFKTGKRTYRLKTFFDLGGIVEKNGEAVHRNYVVEKINKIKKIHPTWSDEKIRTALAALGVKISRRTVAKYRKIGE